MKKLKEELERQLIEKLGMEESSWELAMAEPVAEKAGEVADPERMAEQIIKRVIANMPPEITYKGERTIKVYFNSFNYDGKKRFLMEAVVKK